MVDVERPPAARAARLESIRRAAIGVFTERGYTGTSMANIAEAAGVSRPALYQYFRNREDVFRSALGMVLDDVNRLALAELGAEGSVVARLEGYLQRGYGDLYEMLSVAANGDEILDAKHSLAADVFEVAQRQRRSGLEQFLTTVSDGDPAAVARAADLLELAPLGLKADQPDMSTYRVRLTALATAASGFLSAH